MARRTELWRTEPRRTEPCWARVVLVEGRSRGALWEVSSAYPEARLTLGSAKESGWRIEADGVHPVHCDLYWDGRSLWVADRSGRGGVRLDGQAVGAWRRVRGRAELRVGRAAMSVETSTGPEPPRRHRPATPRPVTLEAIELPDSDEVDHWRGTPVFGGAAADSSVLEVDLTAARVVETPLGAFGPRPRPTRHQDDDGAATRVAAPRRAEGRPSGDRQRQERQRQERQRERCRPPGAPPRPPPGPEATFTAPPPLASPRAFAPPPRRRPERPPWDGAAVAGLLTAAGLVLVGTTVLVSLLVIAWQLG
ncbi:MAG: FHA domain-containing protein [Sandaracinaceae bacterium]